MSEPTEPTGADAGHADAPAQPRDGDPAAPKAGTSNGNGQQSKPQDGSAIWAKAKTQTERDLLKKLGASSVDEALELIRRARATPATEPEPDDDPAIDPPPATAAAPSADAQKMAREIRRRDRDIADRDRKLADVQAKADALASAIEQRSAAEKSAKRDTLLERAARAANAHDPLAVAVLLRERLDIDDDGEPIVKNTEGVPTSLTVEELVEQWSKQNPWGIKPTAPAGAGSSGAPQVGAAVTGPVTIDKIDVTNPQALLGYIQSKAGGTRK